MTIQHTCMYVSDIKRAVAFYLTALQPLGYTKFKEYGKVVGLKCRCAPDFWLVEEKLKDSDGDNDNAKQVLRVHIAFAGSSKSEVHKFHEAALKAGATCNGPPGYRPQYADGYYAAFVLDEDGNNIEVVYFAPWWFVALKAVPYLLGIGALSLTYLAGKKAWF